MENHLVKMTSTIDPSEVEKFSAIADEWWSETGKFKPLHQFNPIRISYIRRQIIEHFNTVGATGGRPHEGLDVTRASATRPYDQQKEIFSKLKILDVGCGGGLIAEPFARLGANITAIDASEKNIKIAQLHAEKSGLQINYRNLTAEGLMQEGEKFDAVFALEIIEHVADVDAFILACSQLVKENGLLFIATMNRTIKSLAFAKFAAEYVLRWLPVGTHDWKRFMKPSEINSYAEKNGLQLQNLSGFSYNILTQQWRENANDLDVNFICTFLKK